MTHPTPQYKCPSFYDDDHVLRDCTCGRCDQPTEDSIESGGNHTVVGTLANEELEELLGVTFYDDPKKHDAIKALVARESDKARREAILEAIAHFEAISPSSVMPAYGNARESAIIELKGLLLKGDTK